MAVVLTVGELFTGERVLPGDLDSDLSVVGLSGWLLRPAVRCLEGSREGQREAHQTEVKSLVKFWNHNNVKNLNLL